MGRMGVAEECAYAMCAVVVLVVAVMFAWSFGWWGPAPPRALTLDPLLISP